MAQQARLSPRRRLGNFRLGEEVAHNTPSGFWGFKQEEASGLVGQFTNIRDGEGGTYQACDRLLVQSMRPFPNGEPPQTYWGHDTDTAPAIAPGSWWEAGPPDPDPDRADAWRSANGWVGTPSNKVCLLYEVAKMNVTNPDLDPSPSNPATGSFRVVISRALFGLSRG